MRTLPTDPPEIRCTAPHPKRAGLCNHRIADILPGTVSVTRDTEPAPGCVVIQCRICGTRYRVCPTVGVGRAA